MSENSIDLHSPGTMRARSDSRSADPTRSTHVLQTAAATALFFLVLVIASCGVSWLTPSSGGPARYEDWPPGSI